MAAADYFWCSECGNRKVLYDADWPYDFDEYPDTGLWGCGAIAALCRDCAQKFEVVMIPKGSPEDPRNVRDALLEAGYAPEHVDRMLALRVTSS